MLLQTWYTSMVLNFETVTDSHVLVGNSTDSTHKEHMDLVLFSLGISVCSQTHPRKGRRIKSHCIFRPCVRPQISSLFLKYEREAINTSALIRKTSCSRCSPWLYNGSSWGTCWVQAVSLQPWLPKGRMRQGTGMMPASCPASSPSHTYLHILFWSVTNRHNYATRHHIASPIPDNTTGVRSQGGGSLSESLPQEQWCLIGKRNS